MIRNLAAVLLAALLASLLAACGPQAVEETAAPEGPYLYILGVAQDAGYPQADCYRPHCMRGWEDVTARRRATSLALIDPRTGSSWLFEATPHMPEQLYSLHVEAPEAELSGVFLTHGHIGHYTGLIHFGREVMGANAMPVFAMPRMRAFLTNNGPWSQLVSLRNINLVALEDGEAQPLIGDMRVTPFLVPHRDEYTETVGFRIEGPTHTAIFIPDIDKWERWDTDLAALLREVDYAFLDATFYAEGEIPGRSMADIPHPFVVESMALLEGLTAEERAHVHFIHFNHTNPLLDPEAPERDEVLRRGFRIADEGMRFPL